MRTILKWSGIGLGGVILLMAALAAWQRKGIVFLAENWGELTAGVEIAATLKSPDDVLEYIATNRDHVSLAAWSVGDEANGIFLNADVKRPLASTVKILVLAAYAEQVEAGTLDPEERVRLSDWERYWLPGTDGGSHDAALAELRTRARITDGNVALDDAARAMIRYSDNAATDLLMERIGRERLEALPGKLALPNEDAPVTLAGSLLTWKNTRSDAPAARSMERYRAMDRRAYADEAWQLMEALRGDDVFRQAEIDRLKEDGIGLTLREQADFAKLVNNRGSARGYARLMEQVATDSLPGRALMATHLEWPMQNQPIREDFEVMGTKGGSLPGILTAAYYARPKGEKPYRVLALSFQDLPTAVWAKMSRSFVHQRFEARLLEDDAFFEQVKARLGAATPGVPQPAQADAGG